MDKNKSNSRLWIDLVIAAGMIGCLPAGLLVYHGVAYAAGSKNAGDPFFVLAIFIGGLGACFLAAAIRLRILWKSSSVRKRILRALPMILWLPTFLILRPFLITEDPFLVGVRDRIIAQGVDFEQVRAWGKAHPDYSGFASIEGLDPADVVANSGRSALYFHWQGGWGIRNKWTLMVILSPEEPAPPKAIVVTPGVFLYSTPG